MKFEFKMTGCPYEDGDTLDIFAHALDLHAANRATQEKIRTMIKHGSLCHEHQNFLRDLIDTLYVEGVDN